MAVGNMDKAYRAVKLIRNPGVSPNMASVQNSASNAFIVDTFHARATDLIPRTLWIYECRTKLILPH